MKFITTKGAPDIPIEILGAQESQNLVFFCGAGISYPAGLPLFSKLVDDVYDALAETPHELEQQALKSNLYDRVLGLLEARLQGDSPNSRNLVMREIIKQLVIPSGANLDTHKALLELSITTNNCHRIVTTNADTAFQEALPTTIEYTDAAPKLPVPKSHKWSSIVHLHGIINEKYDPEGENLVFTSGDFGSAYLTERWASKFVTELFLNFTVVFIGYSIDDPVMRYITDAIAAEKRKGGLLFNEAYVIAESPPSKRVEAKELWKSKGVVPILYSKGNKYHSNLHKTLIAWAKYVKSGLNSKKTYLQREASIPPSSADDNTEPVRRVIDIIRERSNTQSSDITGRMARVFSRLIPIPPIEWLPVFEKHKLLELPALSNTVRAVDHDFLRNNLKLPNDVSFHLWTWLAKHVESKELIEWVILNGGCLHPRFLWQLKHELNKSELASEKIKLFWRLITSGNVRCCFDELLDFNHHPPKDDFFKINKFIEFIQPSYSFEKGFDFFSNNKKDEEEINFNVEVSIPLEGWQFKQIEDHADYPNAYVPYLKPIVECLIKTMYLMQEAGLANHEHDRSNWDLKSIAKHEQNYRFKSWTYLIELSRDLWEALHDVNPTEAKLMFDYWSKQPFPVFKRLMFHVLTTKEVVGVDESLEVLFLDDCLWLWSSETKLEKFRLLDKIWPKLSDPSANILQDKIIKGPSRDLYNEDVTDEKYLEILDRERWFILSKLKTFGRDLNNVASELFLKISTDNPKWVFQDDDRNEFSSWHESWTGNKTDINVNELEALLNKDFDNTYKKLVEENFEYHAGRIDSLRYLAKEEPEQIVKFMEYLSNIDWDGQVWRACLSGLAEADNGPWDKVAFIILQLSLEQTINESWAIANWIKSSVKIEVVADDEEHLYYSLIEKVFLAHSQIVQNDYDDAINSAINNSVGMLTEFLIEIISYKEIKTDQGLPEGRVIKLLEILVDTERQGLIFGRIILASRLHYFHSIDSDWTEEKLVPLLDYNKSAEAFAIWKGYLWGRRVSADLARIMKSQLLESLSKYDDFDNGDQKSLIQFFVFICIEYDDLYTKKEIREVLGSIGEQGLKNTASFLYLQTVQMKEESDSYWSNKLRPFLSLWPRGYEYQNEGITINFVELAAQLDKSFVDCVVLIEPLLTSVTQLHPILIAFKGSRLPNQYPSEVFKLFDRIFVIPERYFARPEEFLEILNELGEAEPTLVNKLRYREMIDYAQAKIDGQG